MSFPWEGFTLRWYQTFIDNAEILEALRTSLWVAALTAVVTTVLAIPASIALRAAAVLRARGWCRGSCWPRS